MTPRPVCALESPAELLQAAIMQFFKRMGQLCRKRYRKLSKIHCKATKARCRTVCVICPILPNHTSMFGNAEHMCRTICKKLVKMVASGKENWRDAEWRRENCFSPFNFLYLLYCAILIFKKKRAHSWAPSSPATLDLQRKVNGWHPIIFIFDKFPRWLFCSQFSRKMAYGKLLV